MAVKSVFEVEVNDARFREFSKLFDKYQSALKSMPAAWKLVNDKIDGTRASFDKLVDSMVASNIQDKLREKAEERADQLTRTTADRWAAMARSTRTVAGNVRNATLDLLKWTGIVGTIGGLLGAGSIWGLDRLAGNVGASRRSALGLGLGYGEQQAFSNFGRLVDPDSFLAAVAAAKLDVTKRVGLLGAGLSQQQIAGGDTADTGVALLQRLKTIADNTNPALYAQVIQGRRLDQFVSPEDLQRLRNTSGAEFNQLVSQYSQRRGQFDLPADVQKKWQDFATQLGNAGRGIETTFVRGLAPLTPGLSKLSDSVQKLISAFLGSPTLGTWIKKLDDGIEKFATYIGTPDFEKNVEDFVTGIGKIAAAIGTWVSWIAGSDPEVAAQRQQSSANVSQLRTARANGSATAWSQFTDIFTGQSPAAQDDILRRIRAAERSSDNAVSPKGAIGRYQIEPGTAKQYGYDPGRLFDPAYNEQVAKAVVANLVRKYHGNVAEVLGAYNAGPGREDQYLEYLRTGGKSGRQLPTETQKYISRATGATIIIENNTGGNATVSVNGLKN